VISVLWRAADRLRRRRCPADHGRTGEDLAHRYLREHGCTVVARNYRPVSGSRAGELDLVVWHDRTLVFVEVKTRMTAEFGEPEGAVDAEKQEHLRWAARSYSRRAGIELEQTRFDIVSVVLGPQRRIDWLRDAFR